jgi:drug/metabolite transporter (DMT)-like permease
MCGLLWLFLPGLTAPDPPGALMMAASGIAWGVYSLRGRSKADPLAETTGNFLRAALMALPICLIWMTPFQINTKGVVLAVLSGTLASGCGYVLWYQALKGLSASRAALVQLLVPVLAAAGGVLFMTEAISLRLLISAGLILSGVGMAIRNREQVKG